MVKSNNVSTDCYYLIEFQGLMLITHIICRNNSISPVLI